MPKVALFDLDGTLSFHDTLMPFLKGYLHAYPARLPRLGLLPAALLRYALHPSRGELKSRMIRLVMGGEPRERVESWAEEYVASLQPGACFRTQALTVLEQHRHAGDHLVLLSASPDLYVPRIGRLLGFERTLCTEVRWRGSWLDGALLTENRRGEEKVRCLIKVRETYPGLPVVAYGNAHSDLAHLKEADHAVLVNANASARRAAASLGIPTLNWT